jgi:hypothetical protein
METGKHFNMEIMNENEFLPFIEDEPQEEIEARIAPIAEEIWNTETRILLMFVKTQYS